MTLLQNIVISGTQGLLMLMGSKFLIKMTRPQNIKRNEQCFAARLVSLTKFTDQQSHTCALLILTHAAIQVAYINIFRESLWYAKFSHLWLKQEDKPIE